MSYKINSDLISVAIIIAIGLGILIARRYFIHEAFQDMQQQCGVDMPPCSAGTKCQNGYCL